MMKDDRSDDDLLQDALPGSTRFFPKFLCPNCGWHFPKGLTDPDGKANAIAPDTVTICGKCLAVLKFGDDLAPVVQDRAAIMKWDEEDRRRIGKLWMLAMLARVLGPDLPDEKMQ